MEAGCPRSNAGLWHVASLVPRSPGIGGRLRAHFRAHGFAATPAPRARGTRAIGARHALQTAGLPHAARMDRARVAGTSEGKVSAKADATAVARMSVRKEY
jgi:hypothetical protein